MSKLSISAIKKSIGISYLGGCNSPKLTKSMDRNVLTYGVYMAPADLSGYNVCPESVHCRKYCLNGSGRNKLELLANKNGGPIQRSRTFKTRLFFENREAFMQLLVYEIGRARCKAERAGMSFAVRLNCTLDISPKEFILNGGNILEIFPDVQFYDYTKAFVRAVLCGAI